VAAAVEKVWARLDMDNSNDLDGTELAAYLKEMNFT